MAANPLVGTWRLISFDVQDEDGNITHPFGRDAVGFITYTADGHMAV
jgi:Lipocalin-like domain